MKTLKGLNGIVARADDVLVFGNRDTMEQAKIDHDNNLNPFYWKGFNSEESHLIKINAKLEPIK